MEQSPCDTETICSYDSSLSICLVESFETTE